MKNLVIDSTSEMISELAFNVSLFYWIILSVNDLGSQIVLAEVHHCESFSENIFKIQYIEQREVSSI